MTKAATRKSSGSSTLVPSADSAKNPRRQPAQTDSSRTFALTAQALAVQRTCGCGGNGANADLLRREVIQPRLSISAPGDALELEANRAADEVMRMPARPARPPTLSQLTTSVSVGRSCDTCASAEGDLASVVARATAGGGQALDESAREFMEPRFGRDFTDVRVHTSNAAAESARAMDALAYTVGNDIVFAAGQYAPHTEPGRRLIAHELAHTAQQSRPVVSRKLGPVGIGGCAISLGMDIGIYGSRATAALASTWQGWLNSLWRGSAACHGNSAGACDTHVTASVTAHPDINWWWKVPEANSSYVREPGYRAVTNVLIDSGDWPIDADNRTIVHEVGHLMGQKDYYWRLPFLGNRSQSGYVNDIMANCYQDPGPTEYGPALSRILADHNINCPCCIVYPPCSANNCALNPGLPCSAVGGRRHCEWIRAHNTPEAVTRYGVDCATLSK